MARKLDEQMVEAFIELAEDAGCDVRSYSGRGMYGDQCVGIEVERGRQIYAVIADMLEAADDDAEALAVLQAALRGAKEDSMGLGAILYFEALPWPADRAEDGDDDED